MVFFAAPVIRTVARMLFPSTRQPMICARFLVLSLFILTIMLERPDGKAQSFAVRVHTPDKLDCGARGLAAQVATEVAKNVVDQAEADLIVAIRRFTASLRRKIGGIELVKGFDRRPLGGLA
jgi:hypothetical protein